MPALPSFLRKLSDQRWYPRSRLARFTLYIVGTDLLLYIAQQLFVLAHASAAVSLGGWITLLTFVGAVLVLLLLVQWFQRRVMWRLRNRLITTYVFIGVVPVLLLVAMAALAGYIFAGQFATFIVTSDIQSELRTLDASNASLASGLAAQLRKSQTASSLAFAATQLRNVQASGAHITAWYRGGLLLPEQAGTATPPPGLAQYRFSSLVRDHGQLYLRAVINVPVNQDRLTVMSSVPLGQSLLQKIAADLGQITLYAGGINFSANNEDQAKEPPSSAPHPKGETKEQANPNPDINITIDRNGVLESGKQVFQPMTVGKLPAPTGSFDRAVHFFTAVSFLDWQTGDRNSASLLTVATRLSRLYDQLFSNLGRYSGWAAALLGIVAAVFVLIELLALLIGIRLTRTMTRSVAELYNATQHVNRGNFAHRIVIKSQDQLAALEGSFNSMIDSIQKLLAEQKEKQRMENELAIAQEVQAQLFPREVSQVPSLELHGFCRPARTVSGDYYDFVPLSPDRITLAVGDVSGKGISAALLMATLHSAVRAYSLEAVPVLRPLPVGAQVNSWNPGRIQGVEVSPAALVTLLNQQLYRSTPAEKYATVFLGTYENRSRLLTYSNAGHLPPVILSRDGVVRRLDCGGTVIGLFDGLTFDESSVELRPGDIFLAFSDGVTEPENDFGEFGEQRLIDLVRENSDLSLPRIAEVVTAAVDDWIGGKEQPDDVTLVLARAR